MPDVETIMRGEPRVYSIPSGRLEEGLDRIVEQRNLSLYRIEGSKVRDKQGLLREAARIMGCPEYFGGNWDAFEECVTDLSWNPAEGYVLLYDGYSPFADSDPQGWDTFTEILEAAVEYWREEGVPMYVLLKA